jgi:serine/threonine protein kinase
MVEPDAKPRPDPLIGAVVLGYEITRSIGVGAMGRVYEALERTIGRRAAVKVLLPAAAANEEFVARFKAEARAANAVRHRGIIDIFGFAELPDGRHAIVMEFLEGRPLSEQLASLATEGRRMPLLDALAVLDELALTLSAAHAAGVVHRDLKPTNIFLSRTSEGTPAVKVLDFGIAKLGGQTSLQTMANVVLGTPSYIAPEQAAGRPAAPSMDLYALGVIAFELFTGRLPFQQTEVMALLQAHQEAPPPRPSSLNRALPLVVDEFVLTLLAKRPEERYPSADVVRTRLSALRRELGDDTALPTLPAISLGSPAPLGAPRPQSQVPTMTIERAVPEGLATFERQLVRRSPWPLVGIVGAVVALGGVALTLGSVGPTTPTGERPQVAEAPHERSAERPVTLEPVPLPAATDTPRPPAPVVAVKGLPARPPPHSAAAEPPLRPATAEPTPALREAQVRAKTIGERLARAEAAGAEVSAVERARLERVRARLVGATAAELEDVEIQLDRLDEELALIEAELQSSRGETR